MFRNFFDGPHLLVIAVLVVLLFGYKRLPDAARSLGRSMRIFKSEVDTMRKDDKDDKKPEATAATPPLSGRVMDQADQPPATPTAAPSPTPTTTPTSEQATDERR